MILRVEHSAVFAYMFAVYANLNGVVDVPIEAVVVEGRILAALSSMPEPLINTLCVGVQVFVIVLYESIDPSIGGVVVISTSVISPMDASDEVASAIVLKAIS